ncbi:hypothetical protein KKG41_03960 [Patescibacteria group bacterium]|nr:hypothetical protein [Patescibacteria group bacterium]
MIEKFPGQHESEPDKTKLRVDADLIVDRIIGDDKRWSPEKREELKKHYEDLLRQYGEMELKLPIDDEPMKRVCQVLTDRGFITQDSCEGHGERLPHTFFVCKDQELLRELAHVLARASNFKRFPWDVKIWSGDPYLNPDSPLSFILSPSQDRGIIDPKKDREELLRDLDIIGLSLMDHFNQIYEEDEQS